MEDFTRLFLYIPGIIIFLVGSGQVRRWMSLRRLGVRFGATVVKSNHVIKKNSRGQETYNYYAVMVEYEDAVTGRTRKEDLKSAVGYQIGQPVQLYRNARTNQISILDQEEVTIFNCWTVMIGGALLILLALFQNQGKEVNAMICLDLLFLGAGISMILSWYSLRRSNMEEIKATVTEVYKRQISKETKILRANKFTYYPIVEYQWKDTAYTRKCNENSGNEKTYKVGDSLSLYYDPKRNQIFESPASAGRLIWGIILSLVGILVAASIVAALL